MKKQFLAITLALALCIGLAVPAFAAEDENTIVDEAGFAYTLSKPLVGKYIAKTGMHYVDEDWTELAADVPVYQIVEGTIITPKDPEGTPVKEDGMDYTRYELSDEAGRKESGSSTGTDFSVVYIVQYGYEMDGMWTLQEGGALDGSLDDEPVQPLKAERSYVEGNTYVITRYLSWTESFGDGQSSSASISGSKETYVYVDVLTEEEAAKITEGQKPEDPKPEDPKPTASAFTDVPSWFEKEVAWAVEKEITNGYGGSTTFAPTVECPHAQILTFLWRAEGKFPASAKAPITVASYYQDAVNWAYEKGLIDASFNPDAPCTRAQAVQYIWQALGKHDAKTAASFSDVAADAPYADAVSWAVEKGVTKGYGGADTFAPDRVCNRGEIAAFLYRAYND